MAAVEGFIDPEMGSPTSRTSAGAGCSLLAEMVDHLEVRVSPDGKGLSLEASQDSECLTTP